MLKNKKQKVSNINLANYRKELFKSDNKDEMINLNNKHKFSETITETITENDYSTPIINNKTKNQNNECLHEKKFSIDIEISKSIENPEHTKFSEKESSSDFSQELKDDNIKYEINNKCPGCYPIFQPNQLGHVGPNGCLGDYE
jgi:hypothetical protein